jgi:hypothetical protein
MSEGGPGCNWVEQRVIILLAGNAAARRALQGSELGWRRHLTRDQYVAFHEAGHAVAAVVGGYCGYRLSIVARRDIKIGSTGFLGGIAFLGRARMIDRPLEIPASPRSDLATAAGLCCSLAPTLKWRDGLAVYRTLKARTEEILEDHWYSIKLLAIELNQRKELTQEQIEQILGRHERQQWSNDRRSVGTRPERGRNRCEVSV